jgi:redox-sensitive bicupin YhaK (pirin superfamily)
LYFASAGLAQDAFDHAARDLPLPIRTDARVIGATVKASERITLELDPKLHAYLAAAAGAVEVGGVRINARDGAAIADLATVEIVGIKDAEVILVDAA